jgi:hypothetical protein
MKQKRNAGMVCLLLFIQMMALPLMAQNTGNETKNEEYTRVITERANKIVDGMSFESETLKMQVRNIIVDHYRFLNDQEEKRNEDVAAIREKYAENKELRDAKIDLRKAEQELKVRDNHFAFNAKLKAIISEEQIDQVKDGLTYGVLPLTYQAHLDMIPTLKEEEKLQIKIWLIEAREHAIDGGDSKAKHGWFGKYKGKINNYLSARGYDLTAERAAWEKRIKEKENSK